MPRVVTLGQVVEGVDGKVGRRQLRGLGGDDVRRVAELHADRLRSEVERVPDHGVQRVGRVDVDGARLDAHAVRDRDLHSRGVDARFPAHLHVDSLAQVDAGRAGDGDFGAAAGHRADAPSCIEEEAAASQKIDVFGDRGARTLAGLEVQVDRAHDHLQLRGDVDVAGRHVEGLRVGVDARCGERRNVAREHARALGGEGGTLSGLDGDVRSLDPRAVGLHRHGPGRHHVDGFRADLRAVGASHFEVAAQHVDGSLRQSAQAVVRLDGHEARPGADALLSVGIDAAPGVERNARRGRRHLFDQGQAERVGGEVDTRCDRGIHVAVRVERGVISRDDRGATGRHIDGAGDVGVQPSGLQGELLRGRDLGQRSAG